MADWNWMRATPRSLRPAAIVFHHVRSGRRLMASPSTRRRLWSK